MNRTIIIAEAGVNHNGDLQKALALIDAAAAAGADYVKFQTFKADKLVSPEAKQAAYQSTNMGKEISQYEMLKALELNQEQHYILKKHAESKGIKFLSTGFDDESIDFLVQLGSDYLKIPSGEATNYLYLKKVASYGLPVILSTGMCTMEEVEWSLNTLEKNGVSRDKITLLHCTTEYPAPMEGVNLNVIQSLANLLGVKTGYSDHTQGIEVSIAAVALGAVLIEKHFTLDRNLPGPDHKASLEPNELKQMITAIRNIEKAMGDGIKKRTAAESKNIVPARKSLFFSTDLNKGSVLALTDLIAKRPGDGISANKAEQYIGKKLKHDVKAETKLKQEDFE